MFSPISILILTALSVINRAEANGPKLSSNLCCYDWVSSVHGGSQSTVITARPCTSGGLVIIKTMINCSYYRQQVNYMKSVYSHSNRYIGIPRFFDEMSSKSQLQVVMQYFEGRQFADLAVHKVEPKQRLVVQERIMRIMFKVLLVINWIHMRGSDHGDLHPGNILHDDEENVMLIDMSGCPTSLSSHDARKEDIYRLAECCQTLIESIRDRQHLLTRLVEFIKAITDCKPICVPSAADLLRHALFREDRRRFGIPDSEDPAKTIWLLKIIELKGDNRRNFDNFCFRRHVHAPECSPSMTSNERRSSELAVLAPSTRSAPEPGNSTTSSIVPSQAIVVNWTAYHMLLNTLKFLFSFWEAVRCLVRTEC